MKTHRRSTASRGVGRQDRMLKKQSRGFTLVELLVVVSIIALLISILLPSLKKAREQAKLIKCVAHMRGVGQAAMVFAGDHGSRMQIVASDGNVRAADPDHTRYSYGAKDELLAWPVALAEVLTTSGYRNNWDWGVRASDYDEAELDVKHVDEDLELFICPSDRVKLSSSFFPRHQPSLYGEGLRGEGDPQNPNSPADRMSYWGRLSYGVNEDIAGGDGADVDFWPSCWRVVNKPGGGRKECIGGAIVGTQDPCFGGIGSRLRGNMEKVYAPGRVGLFFETGPESKELAKHSVGKGQYANLVNSTAQRSMQNLNGPYLGNAQQMHPWRIPPKRHLDGRMNVAFADGHGETVRAKEYQYNSVIDRELPSEYAPRVRVSPFNPYNFAE